MLAGQPAESKPATKGGEYLILIGAFSNEANVKNLKAKLGEQGIKTFSEPLCTTNRPGARASGLVYF